MSQTKNSTHFLCVNHVRRNIEKKLSEWLIPSMLQHGILEDILGEKGLINEESLEDYDERLVSLIEKWNEIEKYHTKNDPPGKFATYFMKFKAKLLRSKVVKPIRNGAEYKGDYTENCIEWVNFLSKNKIDAGEKSYHKCITIHEAIRPLKDRFLRLYRDAVNALYGEGKYKLSGDYSPFLILYMEWMAEDDEFQKMEVFGRFLNEPLPPLAKKYISNDVTENISKPSSNVIETTITPNEKQFMNKNGLSIDNTIVDNSRSKGNEEKPLQPKEMSIKYKALNLPEDIIPLQTVKAAFRKAKELLNDKNGICKEAS